MADEPSKEALEAAHAFVFVIRDEELPVDVYERDLARALDAFAASARAEERERCANVVEQLSQAPNRGTYGDIAAAIRALPAPPSTPEREG